MQHELLDQFVGTEAHHVVQGKERQRDQGGKEVLALELAVDLGHHPAQQTGEHQHQQGDGQNQRDAAKHSGGGQHTDGPVDDDAGQQDHAGEHQTHQVYTQQPGGQNGTHGDRQRQQQVVVLGLVQAGERVEHAAKHAHQHTDQGKEGEVQPIQTGLVQGSAQTYGEQREHTADNAHHQQHIQHDQTDGACLGPGFVLFRVVEVAAEDLGQLFFQQ